MPPGAASSPGTSVHVPLPDEPTLPGDEPEWLSVAPAARRRHGAALLVYGESVQVCPALLPELLSLEAVSGA